MGGDRARRSWASEAMGPLIETFTGSDRVCGFLRYKYDMNIGEIAEILGTTQKHVSPILAAIEECALEVARPYMDGTKSE